MRDHLDDLVAGHAVLQRLSQVELELVAPVESDQTGDGDEAAVRRAEPRPPPYVVEQDIVADLCKARRDVAQGARIGVFMSAMASVLFVEERHLALRSLCD